MSIVKLPNLRRFYLKSYFLLGILLEVESVIILFSFC